MFFKEIKIGDDVSSLAIQSRLLEVLGIMFRNTGDAQNKKPVWAGKIKEILHDDFFKSHTLDGLAITLGIHPVHLSRYFPKYFHCGLAEYLRKLRVEKSLALLASKALSLTEVAFECGFSDQSHFSRCFKDIMGVTPLTYKKLIHC